MYVYVRRSDARPNGSTAITTPSVASTIPTTTGHLRMRESYAAGQPEASATRTWGAHTQNSLPPGSINVVNTFVNPWVTSSMW